MMLSRVVARGAALGARPTPRAFLTSSWQQQRSYAAKPPKSRPFPQTQKAPNPTNQNQSPKQQWQPRPTPAHKPTNTANAPRAGGTEQFSQKQPEYNKGAAPERNTPDGRSSKPAETSRQAEKDVASEQVEFDGAQNPKVNTTPNAQPRQSNRPTEPAQPQAPQQPLPDLRHGIPSTFAEEFLKQQKQPETPEADKPDPTGSRHNLDITEAEPSASGGGSRTGGGGEGDFPKSAYETSQERRRNQMANYMYISIGAFMAACTVFLGRNWETEEEEKANPEAPSGWGFSLFYNRAVARLSSQLGYWREPTFPKLLPKMDPEPPYTLVISLEDMLIHNEWTREHGWRTAKRPGMDYFLRYLCQYYELVLFTSLPSMTADPVIRKLDPYHIISWPLFREATRYEKGEYIKDLSYLNRDLRKVILVDSKAVHAKHQPENSIILPPWEGDPKDKDLVSLIPFLEYIASMATPDVRKVIQSFKDTHIPTEFARREALMREEWVKRNSGRRRGGVSAFGSAVGLGSNSDKSLTDRIREQGQKQYETLEKEIRENGEKWLKEMEAEEKKNQDEQMKSMRGSFFGFFGGPDGSGNGQPAGEGSKP